MRRVFWGTVYCLIGTGFTAAAALLIRSVLANSEPPGLAGVSLCIISLFGARIVQDRYWLKSSRDKVDADREALYRDQVTLQTREALVESHIRQVTRDLEQAEADGRAQLAAEREEMLADIEDHQNAYRLEGFEVGLATGLQGVAAEREQSNVIRFPVSPPDSTTMGQGIQSN